MRILRALGAATISGLAVLSTACASPAHLAAAHPAATPVCRPAAALPWRCGTFRSVFGDSGVTGSTGGPKQDPLELSLTTGPGRIVLTARTRSCLAAAVPMRVDLHGGLNREPVLERAGAPRFSGSRCATTPTGTWAQRFLSGSLRSADGTFFGSGKSIVILQYLGTAPLGRPQLPRNDRTCVAAHIAPFSCGTYRSTEGTGALAFLASRPYRLSFQHANGELEATMEGRCNALTADLEVDGHHVVVSGGASTAEGCLGRPGRDDDALAGFFRGVLTFWQHGSTVTFASGASSATFTS